MIKIDIPVIVEGKYDKITLENVIDATIITTNGFGIYKDAKKRDLIKKLAEKNGVVIITDSDYAGAQIRSLLKNICGEDNIRNVYIPQIKGKEKRKKEPGKQGLLGLEGLSEKLILDSLKKCGVFAQKTEKVRKITKQDLYLLGLSGKENSSFLRKSLAQFLEMPDSLSSNGFLDVINALYSYDKFINEVKKWQQDADKK